MRMERCRWAGEDEHRAFVVGTGLGVEKWRGRDGQVDPTARHCVVVLAAVVVLRACALAFYSGLRESRRNVATRKRDRRRSERLVVAPMRHVAAPLRNPNFLTPYLNVTIPSSSSPGSPTLHQRRGPQPSRKTSALETSWRQSISKPTAAAIISHRTSTFQQ